MMGSLYKIILLCIIISSCSSENKMTIWKDKCCVSYPMKSYVGYNKIMIENCGERVTRMGEIDFSPPDPELTFPDL